MQEMGLYTNVYVSVMEEGSEFQNNIQQRKKYPQQLGKSQGA